MDINGIISSGLLESYVIGTASEEEAALVHGLCRTHPYVLQEIESIEASLLAYANLQVPAISPLVKEKLFEQLQERGFIQEEKSAARLQTAESSKKYFVWPMAAILLLLAGSTAFNLILYSRLQHAHEQLLALQHEKQYLAEQNAAQQVKPLAAEKSLSVFLDPAVKAVRLAGKDAAAGNQAKVYWNKTSGETWLSLISLPALPGGKQYQLWAIADGKPLDAGVFDVAGKTVPLQRMKDLKVNAQVFAVTIENKGGSAVPTLSTMCMMGEI